MNSLPEEIIQSPDERIKRSGNDFGLNYIKIPVQSKNWKII